MEESEAFTPDQLELAWAAGLFDGEGYISFRYQSNGSGRLFRRIEIQITQIDTFVLERFARAVGHGKVHGPLADQRGRRNPCYKLNIAGYPSVWETWVRILPYLSPIKIEQGHRAFTLYRDSPVSISVQDRHLYATVQSNAAVIAARKECAS